MTTIEKLKLGFAAIEGYVCECEPEVNAAPCRMCAVNSALKSAATEIEALQKEVEHHALALLGTVDERDELRRQNAALASALRKVVSWYDSKDSIDVLIDIEKEVKEALAAQPEGGAK